MVNKFFFTDLKPDFSSVKGLGHDKLDFDNMVLDWNCTVAFIFYTMHYIVMYYNFITIASWYKNLSSSLEDLHKFERCYVKLMKFKKTIELKEFDFISFESLLRNFVASRIIRFFEKLFIFSTNIAMNLIRGDRTDRPYSE